MLALSKQLRGWKLRVQPASFGRIRQSPVLPLEAIQYFLNRNTWGLIDVLEANHCGDVAKMPVPAIVRWSRSGETGRLERSGDAPCSGQAEKR